MKFRKSVIFKAVKNYQDDDLQEWYRGLKAQIADKFLKLKLFRSLEKVRNNLREGRQILNEFRMRELLNLGFRAI